MSAPALAPRPTVTRPTSPVRRAAPARPATGGSSRAGASRAPQPRGTASRTTTRATTSRGSTSRDPGAREAGARAGSSRAAAAVQGYSALALQAPERVGHGATRVRVVERPQLGARRIGFAVSCTALLGALMLGLLLLNVAISGNAFTIADLQSQRSLLVDQQQSLEQQLLTENSPSSLATRARAIGMVPAPQVLVLAPDGTGAAPIPPTP